MPNDAEFAKRPPQCAERRQNRRYAKNSKRDNRADSGDSPPMCHAARLCAGVARDLAAELSEARSPTDEVSERGGLEALCERFAGFATFHDRYLHLWR